MGAAVASWQMAGRARMSLMGRGEGDGSDQQRDDCGDPGY